MKKLLLTLLSLFFFSFFSYCQVSKKQKDHKAIESLCGCYEVEFAFAETFNYSNDTLYEKSKNKISYAKELVKVIEKSKSKISLQHLLIIGDTLNEKIIKHWRQDWVFENKHLLIYNTNNKWTRKLISKKEAHKKWSQKVFQVDESPRYEGIGTWIHVDGKSYWESESYAPLPRREYTKRNDYNLMLRRNRHQLTNFGWIHEQDNDKLIKKGDSTHILAKEKGFNTYKKIPEKECRTAELWWEKNKQKWGDVRNIWEKKISSNNTISIKNEINGVKLYQMVFNLKNNLTKYEIEKNINQYLK